MLVFFLNRKIVMPRLLLFDFINLRQVHNFTLRAQEIFTFRRLSVFTVIVREPVIGLIKWLRLKGLKKCSYVEKCAEFKNQTLKKIGWYTKVLCPTEYPWGMQYLIIALK